MTNPTTSAPRQRRGNLAGIGVVDLALLVCFIVVGTRFEFPDNPQGPGLALAIRLMAGLVALGLLVARVGKLPKGDQILSIAFICGYLLAINLLELTYFSLMATVSVGWGLAVASVVISSRAKPIDFVLSGYLVFHIVGLAIAVAWYLVFSQFLDLHNILFPFSGSRYGEILNVARFTGFHIEPGTYCNYVYLFVLLRALINRRILDWLNTLAIMSMIAAVAAWSAFAIVLFLVGGLIEFISRRDNFSLGTKLALSYSLGLLALIVLPVAIGYFEDTHYFKYMLERFLGEGVDASRTDKIVAAELWWQNVSNATFIGYPLTETFCPLCLSPQDLGVAPNLAYNFGLLPAALLGFLLAVKLLRNWGPGFFVFFATLAVNKAFFYDPLIWLVIGIILYSPASAVRTGRFRHLKPVQGAFSAH